MSDEAVRVRSAVLDELLAAARREPELECCGLLAGRDGLISLVLPARNVLASATAFEIAPQELFALFRRIRAEGLELLGIYHSHPRGENSPSARDIAGAFYPSAAYFILSPLLDAPRPVRAFRIHDGHVSELTLQPV
jgi:proteasome lid subunit RPN8/RPN11